MQQIPGSGPPVYLQHGFLDSAATWVMGTPEESLGFILADAGFDVWLGNTRGNLYCLNNKYYSNETQEFWDFSWDEMAAYDLPAKLQYVSSSTGGQAVNYIGHSEGTLIAFTEFSQNTTTSDVVNLFIALAPVVYLTDPGELIQLAAEVSPSEITKIFGTMGYLQPWDEDAQDLYEAAVNDPLLAQLGICLVAGCESPSNINEEDLPVIFSHFPSGSSMQDLLHYQQQVVNGTWAMYDYGTAAANQEAYGQSTPPAYSLDNYDVPTAIFSGSRDKFADPTDVQLLLSMLPVPPVYQEEIRHYGHGGSTSPPSPVARLRCPDEQQTLCGDRMHRKSCTRLL